MRIIAEGEISKLYALDKGDTQLPEGAKVLGKNGVFQTSSSEIFDVVKKSKDVFNGFEEIKEKAEITKKIPENIFWIGPRWLYKMWNKNKKEYIILLFYHPEHGYTWCVPKQDGSMASVDFSQSDDEDVRAKISNGHMLVGTMHNHFGARGTAFASGTDDHDEGKSGNTGIHFTMGYMDAPTVYQCEFHVRIVSGDLKKVIKLEEAVDFASSSSGLPEMWDDKVNIKQEWKSKHLPSTTYRGNSWGKSNKDYLRKHYGQDTDWWDEYGYGNQWSGWEGSEVTVINPDSGEEFFLDDLNTFADDVTESASYAIYQSSYPDISGFAGGKALLHAAVMADELQDAIRFHIEDKGKNADARDSQNVLYDAILAANFIEDKIEEFFKEQTKSCKDPTCQD